MKKNIHPKYQQVLFVDSSTGFRFICGSSLQPTETEVFEGKEYPVCPVPISSASHPFFTGSKQFVDAEGRVDKFKKRYTTVQKKDPDKKDQDEESQKSEGHSKEQPKEGKKGGKRSK